MAQFEKWFSVDLMNTIGHIQDIGTLMFTGDNKSHRIGVRLYKNKEPENVTGTIVGLIVRGDGGTVAQSGSKNENSAWVDLPEAAFAVQGRILIFIQIVDGQNKTVVLAASAKVSLSSTETSVDPGTIIPSVSDLISELEETAASIPADYSALSNAVNALTRIELTESGYIGENGEELGNSNYRRTGFIACPANATVSITGFWTGTGAWAYTFYDATQARISGANSVVGSASPEVPNGAAYVRFSSRVSEGETPVAYVANYAVQDLTRLQYELEMERDRITYLQHGIAPYFDATADYAVGDFVIYQAKVYVFTTAHMAGAWIGADAEEAPLSSKISFATVSEARSYLNLA